MRIPLEGLINAVTPEIVICEAQIVARKDGGYKIMVSYLNPRRIPPKRIRLGYPS